MLKAPSRAGRMDEFFPRRVMTPSASLPPPPAAMPAQRQPSRLSRGWASQKARPPTARRRPREYSDCEDSVDSEEDDCDGDGEGRTAWDPDADHYRWRGEHSDDDDDDDDGGGGDDESAAEEEGGRQRGSGGPARGSSTGVDRRSGAEPTASASAAGVAPRPSARSETAARAAAAAERRAATATATGTGEGQGPVAARAGEVAPGDALSGAVEVDAEAEAPAQVVEVSGAPAPARDASGRGPRAPEEAGGALVHAADDIAASEEEEAPALPWPCRRKRGSASLFLSQRQRTGGLRSRGVGVGDGGRDTFQRQALSTVLANGLRTQRLRLGRTSNSQVAAGVARGVPEGQGIHGRVAGGVTCMEFDSQGWYLAVAGETVTVYDFDVYLPKVGHFQII